MKSVILSAFLGGSVLVAVSASSSFQVSEPYTHEIRSGLLAKIILVRCIAQPHPRVLVIQR